METSKDKLAAFFQSMNSLFSKYQLFPMDFLFIIFVLIGVAIGIKKGLLRMLVLLIELAVVSVLVLANAEPLAQLLTEHVNLIPVKYVGFIAYSIIFVFIWAAVIVFDMTIKKWVITQTAIPLRAFGGAVLGGIYFMLLFSLIAKGITLWPAEMTRQAFNSDHCSLGAFILEVAGGLHDRFQLLLQVVAGNSEAAVKS